MLQSDCLERGERNSVKNATVKQRKWTKMREIEREQRNVYEQRVWLEEGFAIKVEKTLFLPRQSSSYSVSFVTYLHCRRVPIQNLVSSYVQPCDSIMNWPFFRCWRKNFDSYHLFFQASNSDPGHIFGVFSKIDRRVIMIDAFSIKKV